MLLLIVIGVLEIQSNKVSAQGQGWVEQAFGAFGVDGVAGMRALVWTAQQPAADTFRASPVAVCTTLPPCGNTAAFVETGYYKGTASPRMNILQQYASWQTKKGKFDKQYDLGDLGDNTWYNFAVLRKAGAASWIVRRNGAKVYTITRNAPDYVSGSMVACGAEGGTAGMTLAVQCNNMAFYANGSWTSFDWTFAQTTSDYCVDRVGQFTALGWGPC
ncbi:MAG: hypothetical protein HY741_20825 [Chloroflexi bacterium]|nr:hypothetical protein [Chloroflexota bacterium]